MWPFDAVAEPLWLALYFATFALHAVLVSYVAIGTGYALVAALRRRADPLAARIRDWLPFSLGAGITAGVGPLLFIQLLYQRRFYTANLLMGPRWGAVVPALILGFYALYLAKASERLRRIALAVGAVCFAFVAWSWTEMHQVMEADAGWRAMYAAGARFHLDAAIVPRLAIWAGAMLALFAAVAAWSASAADRRRLAVLGLAGLGLAGATCAILVAVRGAFEAAHGWSYVLVAAAIAAVAAWISAARRPDGPGVRAAAAATAAALVAGTVVREAPRLALLDAPRAAASEAGGALVFAITLAVGVTVIGWVVRTVRGVAVHD